MTRAWRVLGGAVATISVAGCADPPTGVLIEVRADDEVRRQIGRLRIELYPKTGGALPFDDREIGPGRRQISLPATVAVLPKTAASASFRVVVSGLTPTAAGVSVDQEVVVTKSANVTFAARKYVRLTLDLTCNCMGLPPCGPGETCSDGQCRPDEVRVATLPPASARPPPLISPCGASGPDGGAGDGPAGRDGPLSEDGAATTDASTPGDLPPGVDVPPGVDLAPGVDAPPPRDATDAGPLAGLTPCGLWGLGQANAVAVSPDGATVAVGSSSGAGVVALFSTADGSMQRILPRIDSDVAALMYLADGSLVIGAGPTIRIWNTSAGAVTRTLVGHGSNVLGLAVSNDGKVMASSDGTGSLRLWDLAAGTPLRMITNAHPTGIWSVALSPPDGKVLVSGGSDRIARMWNTADFSMIRELSGHTNTVRSVAFAPDGATFATGGLDQNVMIWSRDGTARRTIAAGSEVWSVAYADATTIAAGGGLDTGSTAKIRVWNLNDGGLVRLLDGHTWVVPSVTAFDGGRRLASASWDRTARLWDAGTGVTTQVLSIGHTGIANALAYSPDGATVASGSADKTVKLWRASDGVVRTTLLPAHTGSVSSVAFSPNGTLVASGGYDGTLRLWNAGSGALVREIPKAHGSGGGAGQVMTVAFSPDSAFVASGGLDREARIWRVDNGSLHRAIPVSASVEVRVVAFSPDGMSLLTAGEDIKLWNLSDGRLIRAFSGNTSAVWAAGFSPDGRTVAGGGQDRTLRVYATDDGTLRGMAPAIFASVIRSVAFLPDGQTVAVGGSVGVKLFGYDGVLKSTLQRAPETNALAVSPVAGERKLLGAGTDGVIRVWCLP